ncbi:MAG TPA: beta-N-acetylhexosaminidase [Spirochaetota bacterium]|nr:beta-N-acetylhexosaminidase [Spirochaetota bacterium]
MYKKIIAGVVVAGLAAGGVVAGPTIRKEAEINALLKEMPLGRKIGQMMMVGVNGTEMTPAARTMIGSFAPGGIILFGYNLSSRDKTAAFIADMQKAAMQPAGIPLFISIDQEGGRVRRIIDGVTQFPGNMPLGVVNDADLAYRTARILGIELRLMGVNMNLAPAVDVNNNPENPVINTRSFGSDPAIVAAMGRAYIRGLQESRCMAVVKHFPGHGDTDSDSHHVLPVINYGLEHLKKVELPPFAAAIDENVSAVMTAHISYPNILGEDVPATLSEKMLRGLLREEMGHKGLVITDDMEMNAVSKLMDIGEAAVRSVEAGTDIILISTCGQSVARIHAALGKAVADGRLSEIRIDESVRRIIAAKERFSILETDSGRARIEKPRYSKSELESLAEAAVINRELSRRALYYHGEGPFMAAGDEGPYFARYFVTASPVMRRELIEKPVRGLLVLGNTTDLDAALARGKDGRQLVYLHVDRPEPAILAEVARLHGMQGVTLVVLCTGNPFPVAALAPLPHVLFSFSNTDESQRQVVACVRGEFRPRTEVNVYLGIR